MKLPNKSTKQNGGSLVETAMVIPLWIILFLGLVETTIMFKTYSALTQAVREGVSIGAKFQCSRVFPNGATSPTAQHQCTPTAALLFDSGAGTFVGGATALTPSNEQYVTCLNNNTGNNCGYILAAGRTRKILQSLNPRIINGATGPTIHVTVNGFPEQPGSDPLRITVRISNAQYRPLMGLFSSVNFDLQATGPYGLLMYEP
jgi:hypothetical protein